MHFHLPKPLHGWRELAGEVGIIVLGVLIALGAEQVVEAIHWSHETADARAALKAELNHDLGAIKYSQSRSGCARARLADLETFAQSWRDGKPIRLTGHLSGGGSYSFHSNVWDIVKSGQTAAHMSLREKLDYAQIYDFLDNLQTQRQTAGTAVRELAEDTYGGKLTDADLRRMEVNIQIAKSYPVTLQKNLNEIAGAVQRLGLKPDALPVVNAEGAKAECRSLLPTNSQ
jgi:hypothetical protein